MQGGRFALPHVLRAEQSRSAAHSSSSSAATTLRLRWSEPAPSNVVHSAPAILPSSSTTTVGGTPDLLHYTRTVRAQLSKPGDGRVERAASKEVKGSTQHIKRAENSEHRRAKQRSDAEDNVGYIEAQHNATISHLMAHCQDRRRELATQEEEERRLIAQRMEDRIQELRDTAHSDTSRNTSSRSTSSSSSCSDSRLNETNSRLPDMMSRYSSGLLQLLRLEEEEHELERCILRQRCLVHDTRIYPVT